MSKIIRISYTAKREIDDYLKTVLTKNEQGYFEYPKGENDATTAKRFNVNISHVMGIRREAFGQIRKARQETLETRVRVIEAFLDELRPGWRQRLLKLEE